MSHAENLYTTYFGDWGEKWTDYCFQGYIEVIGPKIISLIGGSIGFWVKTTGEAGIAKVRAISERFGVIEDDLVVKTGRKNGV